jgi:hypothetical protein
MASIVPADLVAFHAANSATNLDNDASTVGGAIDLLRRPDFTQTTVGDTVEVISSSASDTQTCTVEARKADGSVVSEALVLTGTNARIFAANGVVDRILKVELSSAAIGTVTVRKSVSGATYRQIPVGERGFSAIFRKGASQPLTSVSYYAKFFWKNTNVTNALLTAQVSEIADATGDITHGLAATVNDSGTSTNRLTAPAGVTFAETAVSVPGIDLASTAAIGVWLKLTLPPGAAAIRSTYGGQLSGTTT